MKYQEFDIPKYNWKVYAFYDTTFDDVDTIMECLYDMGCDSHLAEKAFLNFFGAEKYRRRTIGRK